MTVQMTITLLLLYPLARTYKAILMPRIAVVRSTLLSLGRGRSTRHATYADPERPESAKLDRDGDLSLDDGVQGSPLEVVMVLIFVDMTPINICRGSFVVVDGGEWVIVGGERVGWML
jgi:hypothetical protein